MPFFLFMMVNPSSCNHLLAVSTLMHLGRVGSRTSEGSKLLFIHVQNDVAVKFGFPLGGKFWQMYFTACLSSSSFFHRTPGQLYFPCRVSGKTSSFALNCVHHSIMVRPLLPNSPPIISAASVTPNFKLATRTIWSTRDIAMRPSLCIVPTHSLMKSFNRAFSSSFCGGSKESSLSSDSSSSHKSADVSKSSGASADMRTNGQSSLSHDQYALL